MKNRLYNFEVQIFSPISLFRFEKKADVDTFLIFFSSPWYSTIQILLRSTLRDHMIRAKQRMRWYKDEAEETFDQTKPLGLLVGSMNCYSFDYH